METNESSFWNSGMSTRDRTTVPIDKLYEQCKFAFVDSKKSQNDSVREHNERTYQYVKDCYERLQEEWIQKLVAEKNFAVIWNTVDFIFRGESAKMTALLDAFCVNDEAKPLMPILAFVFGHIKRSSTCEKCEHDCNITVIGS